MEAEVNSEMAYFFEAYCAIEHAKTLADREDGLIPLANWEECFLFNKSIEIYL